MMKAMEKLIKITCIQHKTHTLKRNKITLVIVIIIFYRNYTFEQIGNKMILQETQC